MSSGVRRALLFSFAERYLLIAISLASNLAISRQLNPVKLDQFSVSTTAVSIAPGIAIGGVARSLKEGLARNLLWPGIPLWQWLMHVSFRRAAMGVLNTLSTHGNVGKADKVIGVGPVVVAEPMNRGRCTRQLVPLRVAARCRTA